MYFPRKVNPPPLHCCCALTDHGTPGGAERIPGKAVLCCRIASFKAHSPLSCTLSFAEFFAPMNIESCCWVSPGHREGLEEQRSHFASAVY